MASVIEQLRARDARLVVMVNEGDPLLTSPGAKGCRFIKVRPVPSLAWAPMLISADQCLMWCPVQTERRLLLPLLLYWCVISQLRPRP
jgi:hypothetical protein